MCYNIGKPQWTMSGELSDVTATEGITFQWSCRAYGNPEPTYTWLKSGKKLLES